MYRALEKPNSHDLRSYLKEKEYGKLSIGIWPMEKSDNSGNYNSWLDKASNFLNNLFDSDTDNNNP